MKEKYTKFGIWICYVNICSSYPYVLKPNYCLLLFIVCTSLSLSVITIIKIQNKKSLNEIKIGQETDQEAFYTPSDHTEPNWNKRGNKTMIFNQRNIII
jgi:hypothetical protein